jgi:hypothetical protein
LAPQPEPKSLKGATNGFRECHAPWPKKERHAFLKRSSFCEDTHSFKEQAFHLNSLSNCKNFIYACSHKPIRFSN